jgi:hypothetical protein
MVLDLDLAEVSLALFLAYAEITIASRQSPPHLFVKISYMEPAIATS